MLTAALAACCGSWFGCCFFLLYTLYRRRSQSIQCGNCLHHLMSPVRPFLFWCFIKNEKEKTTFVGRWRTTARHALFVPQLTIDLKQEKFKFSLPKSQNRWLYYWNTNSIVNLSELYCITPVLKLCYNLISVVTDMYLALPPVCSSLVAGHSLCSVDYPRCCASSWWQQAQIVVAWVIMMWCVTAMSSVCLKNLLRYVDILLGVLL